MEICVRLEEKDDYRAVEEMTREAFWNLYEPGCNEHYVVNIMRNSPDFIPELDFVATIDGKLAGSILYTKSYVLDSSGKKHDMASFGPISVAPEFQRRGVGRALVEHSKKVALEMGYKAIFIYGFPKNYCTYGFKSSKNFGISAPDGKFPSGLLVLELCDGALDGISGKLYQSDVYTVDNKKADEFDKQFPHKEKIVTYTQEEFSIAFKAFLI